MRLAIMQPYFLPYLGYFQLISAVDRFVVYDNIEFTKKGWINRNRFLRNGEPAVFTIPLKKGSDFLFVCDRRISEDFDRKKFLNQLHGAYSRAPKYPEAIDIVEKVICFDSSNLFEYIFNSIKTICDILDIDTEIYPSSLVESCEFLKGEKRVLSLCADLKADHYVNPPGGRDLYSHESFDNSGVKLSFLNSGKKPYKQFKNDFVPSLSILDVLMFNSIEDIKANFLGDFELD